MAALMGKDPESGSDTSLEEAICNPGHSAQKQRRDEMDVQRGVDQSCAV